MSTQFAPYAWLITKDFIHDSIPVDNMGKQSVDVKISGPRNISLEAYDRLLKGEGRKFFLFDDDGMKYYEGRYIGPDDETSFAPLDDYGMPNAGCTTIAYDTEDNIL